MNLNILWFGILGVLLTGYAILDGFDLGVGIVHLAARNDTERRIFLNSIGPIWDGNEVWLVTFGGAMFAAFPEVYATVFSAFYLPFTILLFALILRAVSIEFRGKVTHDSWRRFWDFGFFFASTLATLLFGVAMGDAMGGMPIDATKEFAGSFLDLVRPYPLVVGALAVAMFAMHGSIYLYLKTAGELQQRVHGWMWRTFGVFLALYMFTTILTLVHYPSATRNFERAPWVWIVVLLNVLAIANIPRAIHHNKPLYAFVSSSATIAALVFLVGVALFPNMVVSTLNPVWNLTIYNAAASPKTLGIMAVIAFCGMPFVLTYTATVYWVFRGKVELGKFSY
jgi:cytochrome d ubiquinol oxidase subunit II